MHVTSFALGSNNSALSKFTVWRIFLRLHGCLLFVVWGLGWVLGP